MDNKEFLLTQKKLGKTQKQMAELLGVSVKAVQSYSQGWRSIPTHIERQVIFLASRNNTLKKASKPCWDLNNCPNERRGQCPAWEFRMGDLCWLINGTICEGKVLKNWQEKMRICRSCKVITSILQFKL
jgi:hypothetical protein